VSIRFFLFQSVYILKMPNLVSGMGAFSAALRDRPSTLQEQKTYISEEKKFN
jgi:hypothetical protein